MSFLVVVSIVLSLSLGFWVGVLLRLLSPAISSDSHPQSRVLIQDKCLLSAAMKHLLY